MIIFKDKRIPPKHDVWGTELRFKELTAQRRGKVISMLAKLKHEVKEQ